MLTRIRAVLLAACVSAMTSGCLMGLYSDSYRDPLARMHERGLWRERVAELEKQSAAGDLDARTSLAVHLFGTAEWIDNDPVRGMALLNELASQKHGRAEYELGKFLVKGFRPSNKDYDKLTRQYLDRPRGWELLRLAASQACKYPTNGYERQPAELLQGFYISNIPGKVSPGTQQEELWRARDVVHCGRPNAERLEWYLKSERGWNERRDALALIMLLPESPQLEQARKAQPPDMLEAARFRSNQFLALVRESERDYPVPQQ